MVTLGISPKVLYSLIAQVLALVATFVEAGDFGQTQLVQLGVAILTLIVGYLASPGEVVGADGELKEEPVP